MHGKLIRREFAVRTTIPQQQRRGCDTQPDPSLNSSLLKQTYRLNVQRRSLPLRLRVAPPPRDGVASPPSRAAMPTRRRPRSRHVDGDAKEILAVQEQLEAPTTESSPLPTLFTDLPFSTRTLRALTDANYTELTPIQARALPVALRGADILAAAPTGSGKTLAFLLPALELLWRKHWSGPVAGLGVLILAPTRELALQIFQVLQKVGRKHSVSAGLVFGGGTELEAERRKIADMNMLVATPGRLLQHLDQSVGFNPMDLQLLVLDEADRILDMGFRNSLNAILEHLKPSASHRQTMLFSATQTKSISDLAKLSLQNPSYIAVGQPAGGPGDTASWALPENLRQMYMLVSAEEKLTVLWSFLKMHLKDKTIVFMSSCKQVRFVYETFKRMRPGVSLLQIHGRMKQTHRLAMYNQFCSHKSAVLLATDVAARGLDFPTINWVFQVDCPDSVESYIHRAGRTARYRSQGHSLLLLLPTEKPFIEAFVETTGSAIKKSAPNREKMNSIVSKLASITAEDADIKYLGQRAVQTYLRSLKLRRHPELFGVHEIDSTKLAESMGLPLAPSRASRDKTVQNIYGYQQKPDTDNAKRPFDQTSLDVADEEFLDVKKVHSADLGPEEELAINRVRAAALERKNKRLKISKSGSVKQRQNTRVIFDDDDKDTDSHCSRDDVQETDVIDKETVRARLHEVSKDLAERDIDDRQREKQRLRERRRRTKELMQAEIARTAEDPGSSAEEDGSVEHDTGSGSSDDEDRSTNPEDLALKILEGR